MKTGREDYDNQLICVRDKEDLNQLLGKLRGVLIGTEGYKILEDIEENLHGGRIPADEPVFLLRGQDSIAPFAVRHLAFHLGSTHGSDAPTVASILRQADAISAWPKSKLPDLPKP